MKWIKFWTAAAFILALGAVGWAVWGWHSAQQENARQVAALESAMANLDEGQLTHQRNLAKWYNYQLEQGTPGLRGVYHQILNFGDGAMALLEVPELSLKLPVFHGPGGAAGHDPETSLPIGGRGTHTVLVLSSHYRWNEGQILHLNCLGKRLTYRVESIQAMPFPWSAERPTEAGQELLTLVYDRGNIRTLIRCVRCAELVLWETERWKPGKAAVLAALGPVCLIIPAIWRKKRYAVGVHRP